MKNIALVAEGVTDHLILEAVLQAYFRPDGCYVAYLQPLWDKTDQKKEGTQGGYDHVLTYCTCADRILDALTFNDLVIIQIDTDVCHRYGVNTTGQEDCDHMRTIVSEVLYQRLIEGGLDENTIADRLVLAVCVNSIECWLLPFYIPEKKKRAKTSGCIGALNTQLNKKDAGFYIDEENKSVEIYEQLVKPIYRVKKIHSIAGENCSFQRFVEALDSASVLRS